jgi:hypothetical protein
MSLLLDRPLFTTSLASLTDLVPDSDSAYVFGQSAEFRAQAAAQWAHDHDPPQCAEIIAQDSNSMRVQIGDAVIEVALRSSRQLQAFWEAVGAQRAYLDITGLGHHVWAPLVRSGLGMGVDLRAVYIEPESYTYSATPVEGEIFDLSERIAGISPLPGFTRFVDEGDSLFIPLLGFEGTRLAFIVEAIDPPGDNIVPIVGVPGFQPDYPFHTYLGNKLVLEDTDSWKNIRFARANCPFSLYYALDDIIRAYPGRSVKIAPIGTKPHALGAILYALANPTSVELIYDHPVRKKTRSSGASTVLVYHLQRLMHRTGVG